MKLKRLGSCWCRPGSECTGNHLWGLHGSQDWDLKVSPDARGQGAEGIRLWRNQVLGWVWLGHGLLYSAPWAFS